MSKIGRATIPRANGPNTPVGTDNQRTLLLSPVPATPYVDQLNIGAGRRTLAISLALAIAVLLLLVLLSWGPGKPPDKKEEFVSVVSIAAATSSQDESDSSGAKREQAAKQVPPPPETARPPQPRSPLPPLVTEPKPAPPATAPIPRLPALPNVPSTTRPSTGRVYGPPDTGGSSSGDSEQVGTAPNGQPLYAAAWYREPSNDELRGFLSTASGPGWGLIACRTVADYRVDDCVGLDEYPNGSQITRAVLAAAWQFRVRPPRLGGRSMVGSWVRIRIDYGIKGR